MLNFALSHKTRKGLTDAMDTLKQPLLQRFQTLTEKLTLIHRAQIKMELESQLGLALTSFRNFVALLEAIQRCVYFLDASSRKLPWTLTADLLETQKR